MEDFIQAVNLKLSITLKMRMSVLRLIQTYSTSATSNTRKVLTISRWKLSQLRLKAKFVIAMLIFVDSKEASSSTS